MLNRNSNYVSALVYPLGPMPRHSTKIFFFSRKRDIKLHLSLSVHPFIFIPIFQSCYCDPSLCLHNQKSNLHDHQESVFERIPNFGPNQIPEYYLQEQIDRIEYQIIQTLLFI